MSANADLITVETYVHTGKQLKNSCSYMDQNVKTLICLAIGGALGAFSDQTGPILLSSYPLTHIYVHVK